MQFTIGRRGPLAHSDDPSSRCTIRRRPGGDGVRHGQLDSVGDTDLNSGGLPGRVAHDIAQRFLGDAEQCETHGGCDGREVAVDIEVDCRARVGKSRDEAGDVVGGRQGRRGAVGRGCKYTDDRADLVEAVAVSRSACSSASVAVAGSRLTAIPRR